MKKCTKCGIEKSLSEFDKNKSQPGGLRTDCKRCRADHRQKNRKKNNEYAARYYQENKEKVAEKDARYYQKNKERRSEYMARYHRERISKQPACIYQIINEKNGKIYIGETLRGELRWKEHLCSLRAGIHNNFKLQKDFDKFGEEAFEWEILKEFPKDKETLLLEEVRTINKFLKEDKDLYNLSLTIEQLKLLQENGE